MPVRKIPLLLPLLMGTASYAVERPNILWVTIEDTSPHFIGCYGNENARTPVMDKLASEGVRFTNAFSTGTVCSPSRTCLITGVKTYATGTGNHRSNYPLPTFIKGFPWYLRQAGYHTSNNNKTDYNVADPGRFTNEAWDESSGKAGWWNRKPGQPFFAVFNYMDSHQSRTMTNPYPTYQKSVLDHLTQQERIGDNDFDLPPFYNDTPEMRKQFARVYNSIKLTDKKIGDLLARLEKEGLRESTIIFFFGDHGEGIPRGKTNGINLGHRVPFIIWFPEKFKHLSPWGTGGVVTDELIDFNDLAPTLIDLAGGTVPVHMKGRRLMGPHRSPETDHLILSSDRSDNGIDMIRSVTDGKYFYVRNYLPFMPEVRYIRYMEIGEIKQQMRKDLAENRLNGCQKSIFEDRQPEFLFDIESDPWEIRNLAKDPAYRPLLEKMRSRLKEEVLASRDVLFLPEYEIEKISHTTTPYEFRQQADKFPIVAILDAASLSGFRDRETANKQVALLKEENEILRYWGALGLVSQPSDILKPVMGDLRKAMKDSYPPVAVTASAIIWRETGDKNGVEALKAHCSSDNQMVALMAINHLLYIPDKKPYIETIREVHAKQGSSYNVKAACMDFLGILNLVSRDQETGE